MNTTDKNLEALQDIRKMMERSGRFISLSGWSGVAAGVCALTGAWLANNRIQHYNAENAPQANEMQGRYIFRDGLNLLERELLLLAIGVFIAAGISAFIFTYIKSKKEGIAIWSASAQRLMWNTLLPIVVGGMVILRLLDSGQHLLAAPVCLIFYGLALINGSKYTIGEIRYLGYLQIILGLLNLWMPGYGLLFWALGFGVLHILYGILMWRKYECVKD